MRHHHPPFAANLLVRRSVAPFLLLLTPFAVFVHYHRYGFARPEIVIAVLGFAAVALMLGAAARRSQRFEIATIAALLTWCADIQLNETGAKQLVLLFIVLCAAIWPLRQHAARIVSVMMATVLGTSLLPLQGGVAASPFPLPGSEAASAHAAPPSRLPLIVHLVLDEHIGVEGLPDGLTPPSFKEELQSFFVDRGFRLFGRAYSEHPSTLPSLSHLLNLVSGRFESNLTAPGTAPGTFRLTRNAYFERLAQAGYAIRVHRIDYLDVCTGRVAPSACRSYGTSLAALHNSPAPPVEKLWVVGGPFLARSTAVMRFQGAYSRGRARLRNAGVSLPAWNWDRNVLGPMATMAVLDSIAADVARSQPGDLLFAHLLIPHFPYIYDSDCRPRPPREWRQRRDRDDVDHSRDYNTTGGRAIRYSLYLQQVRCAQRAVDRLLGSIPPSLRNDAVIIVQGDHGSRIGMVEPRSRSRSSFGGSDYADFYSTLFAVRSPEVDAGYDLQPAPITCLLRTLVDSSFTSLAGLSGCSSSSRRVAFFGDRQPLVLPDFGAAAADPAP